jgi:predicted small lipoprotein YifL
MKACHKHTLLLMMLLSFTGCGKETRSLPDQNGPSNQKPGKQANSPNQQSQDSSARTPAPSNVPQKPSTKPVESDDSSLPQLPPSKLAWNGETFVGSANFALIPLE